MTNVQSENKNINQFIQLENDYTWIFINMYWEYGASKESDSTNVWFQGEAYWEALVVVQLLAEFFIKLTSTASSRGHKHQNPMYTCMMIFMHIVK